MSVQIRDRSHRPARWLVLFLVVCLAQLLVLYLPARPGHSGLGLDKLVHLSIFAAPMAAGVLARVPAVPLAMGLAVHAVVSEFVQATLLPTRSGDPLDSVANGIGIALGWAVALVIARFARATPAASAVRGDGR